jgi:hypothetical protein
LQPHSHHTRQPRLTIEDVDSLLQRGQRLVDFRRSSVQDLDWYAQAAFLGDLGAIGSAATIAARSPVASR